jgi:molybdate transport system ATP-binding protein
VTIVEQLYARVAARVGALTLDVEVTTASGTLVVIGPNGSGKSSLLSVLLGVLPVDTGRIEVGGLVLLDTRTGISVPPEARRLGYVPQEYALFPHLTARQNVEFSLECAERDLTSAARRREAVRLLSELGLDALAERRPGALSGGEKQRVALARALAASPRALLLDEPLAALDVHARGEVRTFLASYLEHVALPAIVVTHDARDARALGDRLIVLEEGKITQSGTWDELSSQPASRFVERFVADEAGAL